MIKFHFYLVLFLMFIFNANASAQQNSFSTTPVVDALGRPVTVNKYGKLKGSPYLFDEWLPGKVVTDDDKVYKKMLLKYNINTDMLTFVYNKTDEPLRFQQPVKVFTLYADQERVFANQFPKIDGQKADSYYEVIGGGKTITLLKRYNQIIKDTRDDNMAPIDGEYVNRSTYYVYKDQQMYRVKLNKDAILQQLNDKAAQINAFMAQEQLNLAKEEDCKKLFNYYNTL